MLTRNLNLSGKNLSLAKYANWEPEVPSSPNTLRILLLEDDPDAAAYCQGIVHSHFPAASVEVRARPFVGAHEGEPVTDWSLCIFDDDFQGVKYATRIAAQLRATQPQCHLIAISGCYTDLKRQALLGLGCHSVCDKSDPIQLIHALSFARESLNGARAADHAEPPGRSPALSSNGSTSISQRSD